MIDHRKIAVEVRDRITGWPETHEQAHWGPGGPSALSESVQEWAECGTTACVAGHVAAIVIRDHPEEVVYSHYHVLLKIVDIASTAEKAMGYPDDPFGDLKWPFTPCRSREEVLGWLDAVAGGESPQAASDRLSTV